MMVIMSENIFYPLVHDFENERLGKMSLTSFFFGNDEKYKLNLIITKQMTDDDVAHVFMPDFPHEKRPEHLADMSLIYDSTEDPQKDVIWCTSWMTKIPGHLRSSPLIDLFRAAAMFGHYRNYTYFRIAPPKEQFALFSNVLGFNFHTWKEPYISCNLKEAWFRDFSKFSLNKTYLEIVTQIHEGQTKESEPTREIRQNNKLPESSLG